ncbi:hypothetical protein EON68_03945, partial [archaeon]
MSLSGGGVASRKPLVRLDGLTFSSDFDSGRAGGVKRAADGAYEVSIPSDCEELGIRNEYRVWYFFSVGGGVPGESITLRLTGLHQIAKVYNTDCRPLVRVVKHSATWERLTAPCTFLIKPSLEMQITFTYTFVSTSPVYFAYYYPFAYGDCQRLLDNIDRALPNIGALTGRHDAHAPPPTLAQVQVQVPGRAPAPAPDPDTVYYHRELLVYTPDGRRVELLTITSRSGMLPEREAYMDGLFPRGSAEPRCHRFRGKPGIFVSARVHPGETSSSYLVHGLIAFLLQPRNPYARLLRAAFVFKIVPMMNPDGVYRGHFRLDQFGVNLNRAYASPQPRFQP